MLTVTSADGTTIAYERTGSGPALILVGGAFSYRRFPMTLKIAAALAENFTVLNYDRRGRGDSGDTQPYDVRREIEDLEALIDAAGEPAYVWGLSSGAVLAMRAVAAGLPVPKLAVYQPPLRTEGGGAPADAEARLRALLANGDRNGAVRYFMTRAMGAPAPVVSIMRITPVWKRLAALAHTLPYDLAVLGEHAVGKAVDPGDWADVKAPVLVLGGAKAPKPVRDAAAALAAALPDGDHQSLPGQSHVVRADVLAPVLTDFFLDRPARRG